jgi:hypothetical protein
VIAAVLIPVRRQVTDPVLEIVLALVTPYAAWVLGELPGRLRAPIRSHSLPRFHDVMP